MNVVDYHLKELEIAQDANDPRFSLPVLTDSDNVILDIGCGIGQSFIALGCLDRTCIGIDICEPAIIEGARLYGDKIQYCLANSSNVPLPSNYVDLVICRVSLPYTNIRKTLLEIKRVLKPGGRVWITLHSKKMAKNWLIEAMSARSIRDIAFRTYVILNGYLFHVTSLVLPYLNGNFESWQDAEKFAALLVKLGFATKDIQYVRVTAIEATLIP